jgi:hypothetical protein
MKLQRVIADELIQVVHFRAAQLAGSRQDGTPHGFLWQQRDHALRS